MRSRRRGFKWQKTSPFRDSLSSESTGNWVPIPSRDLVDHMITTPSRAGIQLGVNSRNSLTEDLPSLTDHTIAPTEQDNLRKRKSSYEDYDDFAAHWPGLALFGDSSLSGLPPVFPFSRSETLIGSEKSDASVKEKRRGSNASTLFSRASTFYLESFENLPWHSKKQRNPAFLSNLQQFTSHGSEDSSAPNLLPQKPGSPPPGSQSLKRTAIKNNCFLQTALHEDEETFERYQHDIASNWPTSLARLTHSLETATLQVSEAYEQPSLSLYSGEQSKQEVTIDSACAEQYSTKDLSLESNSLKTSQLMVCENKIEDHHSSQTIPRQSPLLFGNTAPEDVDNTRGFEDEIRNSKVYRNSTATHKPSLSLTVPYTIDCARSFSTRMTHNSPLSATTYDSCSVLSIASDYEGEDWLDNLVDSIHCQCFAEVMEKATALIILNDASGTRCRGHSQERSEYPHNSTAVSRQQSHHSLRSHKSGKRALTPGGDDEANEGEDGEPYKRPRLDREDERVGKKVNHKFACPFQKKYPHIKYPCAGRSFMDTHRLKEHLYKRHKQILCPRCHQRFEKEENMKQHSQSVVACTINANTPNPEDGFDRETENALRSRKDLKHLTERGRWERIYKTLFGEDDPVPQPYMEVYIIMDHDKKVVFRERLEQRLTDELVSRFQEFEDNVIQQLREIIRNVTEEAIVDTFGEEHSDPSVPKMALVPQPERMQRATPQDNSHEAVNFGLLHPPHNAMDDATDASTLVEGASNAESFVSTQNSSMSSHEKLAVTTHTPNLPTMLITTADNQDSHLKVAMSELQSQQLSSEFEEATAWMGQYSFPG